MKDKKSSNQARKTGKSNDAFTTTKNPVDINEMAKKLKTLFEVSDNHLENHEDRLERLESVIFGKQEKEEPPKAPDHVYS